MMVTIVLIVTFQAYWISKLYRDEWSGLKKEADIVFRETVYKLQLARFKKDTATFRRFATNDPFNIDAINVLKKHVTDTIATGGKSATTMIISMSTNDGKNGKMRTRVAERIDSVMSTGEPFELPVPADGEPVKMFRTASLNDSLPVLQLDSAYKAELKKASITVPFSITKSNRKKSDLMPKVGELKTQPSSVGFFGAYNYQAAFQNPFRFLIQNMVPQIVFSLLLVAFTIGTFIVLYRNLLAQQRLTAIKNDFISNITHELKTPIATVNVAIEALRDFGGLQNPERTREYLDISASELQRLSLLVDKVLKLTMFEKKEIALKKDQFDLLQLVSEVMTSMKLQFDKQKAVVHLEPAGNNFMIIADRLHITSVIYNLLDNALKYSDALPQILVRLVAHADYVELKVTDNGIGIAHAFQAKIFDQFFRVPTGDQHNTKGYGLGLSYVNHIVKRHHGFIEVESEPGVGSTFTVKLPYRDEDVIQYDQNRVIRKKNVL